jgi:hypothetical protein
LNTASPSQSGCSDYGWLCCNCSTHLSIVSCCCCCSCCCCFCGCFCGCC